MDTRILLRRLGWVVLGLLGAFLFFFLVVARLVRKVHPFPMPARLARLLDNPWRHRFTPPRQVVDKMWLASGMRVLEVGPGPGFYTLEAARRVGPAGCLCAVEISPELAAVVAGKARAAGYSWVHLVVADAQALPLADEAFDHAALITVLGEVPDRTQALRETRRVLRPGGGVTVTEYVPDPDFSLPSTVAGWAGGAGLVVGPRWVTFPGYTIRFRRPG